MYSKPGFVSIILFLASVTFFMLGLVYQGFFYPGFALGVLFFLIAAAILSVMMRNRIKEI